MALVGLLGQLEWTCLTGYWCLLFLALSLTTKVAPQQDNEVAPEFLCPDDWRTKPCTCTSDKRPNLPSIFCDQVADHDIRSSFESLKQPTGFQTLNITNSKLTTFPVSSLQMALFNDIVITKTTLNNMDFLKGQDNLQSLRLTNNSLQHFNFSLLQGFPNLRHFALTGNRQLVSIPANAFPQSSSLRFLNLSLNGIDYIGPNAFAKLQRLDLLDLTGNRLFALEPNAFNTSAVQFPLVLVDLSDNNISEINADAFAGLKTRSLDLRYNNLTSLEEEQFESFWLHGKNEFVSLLVGGNPFTCNSTSYSWLFQQPKTVQRQVIGFRCLNVNVTKSSNSMDHHTATSSGEKYLSDAFMAVLSLLTTTIAMKLFFLHNLKST